MDQREVDGTEEEAHEPAADGRSGNEEGAVAFEPKRRIAPFAALGLALLAGLGGVFALSRPSHEPLRVLVAVDARGQWGEGSTTSADA